MGADGEKWGLAVMSGKKPKTGNKKLGPAGMSGKKPKTGGKIKKAEEGDNYENRNSESAQLL